LNKYLLVTTIVVIFAVSLPQLTGCSLADVVKTDVPIGIQRSIGSESKVSLREASYTWDEWINHVEVNSEQFADNIDRSSQVFGLLSAFTNTGVDSLDGIIGQTPLGATLIAMLAGAAGLFTKTPGTDKKISKEKEDSYNAGLFKGKQIAEVLK
jgi:hypothetical protein